MGNTSLFFRVFWLNIMLKSAADILQAWHAQRWGWRSIGCLTPVFLVTFLSHWMSWPWSCPTSRLTLMWDNSWPYYKTVIWFLFLEGESILTEQMEKVLLWLQRPARSLGFDSRLVCHNSFASVTSAPPPPNPFLHCLSHSFWTILSSI